MNYEVGSKTLSKLYYNVVEKATGNPLRIKNNNKLERTPINDVMEVKATEIAKEEKDAFIKNSPLLSAYNEESEKNVYKYNNYYINVLDKLDINGLKKLEKICEEIYENTKEIDNDRLNSHSLKNFVDIYFMNPSIYKYCLNSENIKNIFMKDFRSNRCIRFLNMAMAKEIEKGCADKIIIEFVENSDDFYRHADKVKKLNELLHSNKITGEITAHRGERHVGQFSNVPINKYITKKIKIINFIKQFKTKNDDFTGYDKKYLLRRKCSIYEYIKNKDELSLSDAMLMMKYLDKNTKNEILELIKNTTIQSDGRFMSTTFSEDFAMEWIGNVHNSNGKGQARIIDKLNLKEGCEGYYVQDSSTRGMSGSNGQFEFILNNIPTEMKVKNVSFDEDKNIFNIEYDLTQ